MARAVRVLEQRHDPRDQLLVRGRQRRGRWNALGDIPHALVERDPPEDAGENRVVHAQRRPQPRIPRSGRRDDPISEQGAARRNRGPAPRREEIERKRERGTPLDHCAQGRQVGIELDGHAQQEHIAFELREPQIAAQQPNGGGNGSAFFRNSHRAPVRVQ